MDDERYSISYEHVIRHFLGDRGYGLAGTFTNDKAVKKNLLKIIPVAKKRVEEIDTTNRHKELLMMVLDRIQEDFRDQSELSYKKSTVDLLSFCALLLGYERLSGKGIPVRDLFYWQSSAGYILSSEDYQDGKNFNDVFDENNRNVISFRREVFTFLKNKKVSDNIIAQILNTSEYKIKKLKKDL